MTFFLNTGNFKLGLWKQYWCPPIGMKDHAHESLDNTIKKILQLNVGKEVLVFTRWKKSSVQEGSNDEYVNASNLNIGNLSATQGSILWDNRFFTLILN